MITSRGLVSAAVLLCALVSVRADGDVISLTESNFDDKLADQDVALLEFFAPWCGHCKRLAPEYEKAATKLKSNDPPVQLFNIDCDAEKDLCQKHGVSGYPTLKIFRKGQVSADYDGPRDADGIVKYMRGQSGPSAKELTTLEAFEKFIGDDDHSILGFFEGESKLKDSFLKVADTERDRFRFAYTKIPELLKKFGVSDDILAYAPKKLKNMFDPEHFKYDGNYDTDKIKEWLVSGISGLAGIRTPSNEFQFSKLPLVNVIYNMDFLKDAKGTSYWRNRVLKIANQFLRKVHFSVSNLADYAPDLEKFGLGHRKDSDKPLVTMLTEAGRFGMDKEFSLENLKEFVEDVIANKLNPFVKSEDVPEEQGDLKVAVAKNFKELIADADKDALIEFYAPWCGHCKTLAPKYEELATKLKDEDVVIAKMDATANDVPPAYEVRGFPTLFWLPKDSKKPVPYSGGREVKDFIKFIAKHSTDGLKGWDKDGKKKKQSDEL